MNEKIKNYLGYALVFGVVVLAVSAWMYARTYSESIQPSSFRSFSVSGEGKVVAVPDVAKFTFSVLTEGGKNIAALQKENTEKINKAISFLKEQKIEAKDIKTENYSLSPRYEYSTCPRDGGLCPPPSIIGYSISQTISVKVRDFEKVGDILAGVINNGANSVSELNFTIDDETVLQNKAREEAISKAKDKAKAIAETGGFSLGRLLAIEEGGYTPQPIYAYGLGGGNDFAEKSAYSAPAIEPGSQDITITVTLRYEIR